MRLIKENNALLSVINLLFVVSLSVTAESYKGSQAYNHEKLFKAQVNTATGTFSFSYPLIEISGIREPLKLHLNYHFNAVGMFGLPTGWRLDLDYISDKTAELGGKQWLIDDLWHDETGYASGLKYYNQHGNRFDDLVEARPIPGFPSMSYRYKTHHKDGSVQYFSHQGLIVLRVDRFGNSIKFFYETPIRKLESALLKEIVDNYGNSYQFNYEPNTIIIHYPDGREQRIYFNKQGVTEIINPLRQSYRLTYISSVGRDLLRTIESPEGLMTELGYDSIPYKKDGSIKQLPVVIHFKQFDLADKKTHHEVNYHYSKGNNYTGYPLYSLSDASDSLIESDNQAYRYSVEVSRVNDKQIHHQVYKYNYLHLPVEVRTSNEGKPHTKVTYEYDISPFKYSRSTNYDKPVSVTKAVWHSSKSSYVPSDRIETSFDLYGNKLMELQSVYNQDTGEWSKLKQITKNYFTDNFSLISEKIEEDLLKGRAIAKHYHLDLSGKNLSREEQRFKLDVKEKDWIDWQKVDYTHDNQGRQRSITTGWLMDAKPGVQTINETKAYEFDKDSAQLTLIKVSNAGRTIKHIMDTRNDRLVKFVSPEGEVSQYKYDALNREITAIDALGNSIKTTYETYCQDGKNTQLHQSPLGEKRRTTLDASSRMIEHQDQYKGHWRTLLRQSYNAFGKVISKTNKIGLTTSSTYDEQERLIQAIDIWKNNYEIRYDDEGLTTTISMNGQRNQLKRKIPWERKEIHEMYPFLNNAYDKPEQYVETHWIKDGFNKTIEAESSLVDLTNKDKSETVLASYQYDAQNNRVLSRIETYDGIVLTKTSEYDLLNKLFTWKKNYHTANKQSTHEGYRYHYDADGLLSKVESPPINGAHEDIFNYRYDKNGREVLRTLRDGNTISYEYDERGLLVQRSWCRNNKRYSIHHHFDADGKLVTLEDNDNQSLHYRYSNTGQLIEMLYPDNQSLSFELDKYDRVIHQTDAHGMAQQFTYLPDDKGKLSGIASGNSHISFHYGKDDNGCQGQLISRQFNAAGSGFTQSNYQYDAFGRLKRSMNINHASQRSFHVDYTHSAWGEMHSQRQKLTGKDRDEWLLTNYEYDGLRRLNMEKQGYSKEGKPFQHWHNAFLYDGNNNIVSETKCDVNGCLSKKTYRYNAQDQLVNITIDGSENRLPITYDTNGRLINDHYGNVYSYDNAGYLLRITDKKRSETYLHYLPNGFLGQSFHQGTHSDFYPNEYQQVTTLYKDNEWHSLVREDHSIIGRSSDRGMDQLFKANQSTGAILALKEAGNTRFDLLQYDGYGKQTDFSTGDKRPIESFGWNQELTETNVGLIYLRHRFYHPDFRRFITRDSFDVDNRYAYASGNPVNTMDPTGHNEAVNYSVGSGFAVLGVVGAIFAVPTGGASLSLSAAAGVGAGVTTALSGISLMGSQMALDAGNKVAAKALSITSITLGSLAMAQGVISLAPTIGNLLTHAGEYLTTSSEVIKESAGAVSATANVTGEEEIASSVRLEVAGTANTGTGAAAATSAATTTAIGEEMASPAVEFLHSGLAEHSVGTMIERLGESGEGKVTHFTSMNTNFHKVVVHQQSTWLAKVRDFLFKRMVGEDFADYMRRDGGGAKILYAEDEPNKLNMSQGKGLFEYFGLPSAETMEGAAYYKASQSF